MVKIICHGRPTLRKAVKLGWLPGARYSNLRDVRGFDTIGLIDCDWQDYSFKKHLEAVKAVNPYLTVARDLVNRRDLSQLSEQAAELRQHAQYVIIVPKIRRFKDVRATMMHRRHILGYSVPTGYGKTSVSLEHFRGVGVHLLGGRPLAQLQLSRKINVVSFDCNSLTIDASFGKYFDGDKFRKHPRGGYMNCVLDSLRGINAMWDRQHV